MPQTIDLHRIDNIIREVAEEVIMPRFRKLQDGDVEMKGAGDPVTIADREAEQALTKRLTDALPGSAVIGEESFAQDKTILSRLQNDAPVWIIDPIDGTRNFVSGKPEFAVMVALVVRQQPVASWIYDPNSSDTIMAEQGGGVWLRGKRMALAGREAGKPLIGLVGSRVRKLISEAELDLPNPDRPVLKIGSCAGFDYPRLFKGEVTFANARTERVGFLIYRQTNVWDHAPGYLMHQEAGGFAADWQGQAYDLGQLRNGLLYAPDRQSWKRLHTMLEPLMAMAK